MRFMTVNTFATYHAQKQAEYAASLEKKAARAKAEQAHQAALAKVHSHKENARLLYEAMHSNNTSEVGRLLAGECDFDLNFSNENGLTLWHIAVIRNYRTVMKVLCAKKADINAQDDRGYTALHYVAMMKDDVSSTIGFLLEAGIDVNIRSKQDYIASDIVHALNMAHPKEDEFWRIAVLLAPYVAPNNTYGIEISTFKPPYFEGYGVDVPHYDLPKQWAGSEKATTNASSSDAGSVSDLEASYGNPKRRTFRQEDLDGFVNLDDKVLSRVQSSAGSDFVQVNSDIQTDSDIGGTTDDEYPTIRRIGQKAPSGLTGSSFFNGYAASSEEMDNPERTPTPTKAKEETSTFSPSRPLSLR
jgi:ankyrin repeat protein